MWEYNYYPNSDELYHHGIMGMHWGKRNGPPYPLGASDHSASEKKAGWRKSLDSDGRVAAAKKAKKDAKKNVKKTAAKARHETNKYQSHLSKNVSPSKKVRKSAEKQRQKAFDSRVDAAVARNDYKKAKQEYKDAKKEVRNSPEAVKRRQETAKKVAKAALIGALGAAVVGGAVVAAKSDVGRKYYKKLGEKNLAKANYKKALASAQPRATYRDPEVGRRLDQARGFKSAQKHNNKRRERDAKKVAEGIANHLNSLGISDKHFYASPGPNISSNNKHK